MLFSSDAFSTLPFSTLGVEIIVSTNGEVFSFELTIASEYAQTVEITQSVSYTLILT